MKQTVTPFYARLACVLVSIVILGYLAILGKEVLAPLFFSFLFAILLLPLANFLENKLHFPRGASTAVSIILLISSAFLLMYLLGSQLAGLADDWPLLQQNVRSSVGDLQHWIQHNFHVNSTKQVDYINNVANDALASGATILGTTVLSVSSILLFNVFILIYTFFLLLYRRLLFKFIVAVFPKESTSIVYEITEQVKYIIGKYVVGLFLEMIIVIGLGVGTYYALGINYALLLGLITGILNIIPYVGIFTALLLGVLITFATGGQHQTVYLTIATLCIHLIDSNVIMPKVVGSKVKINPLIIILGVFVGEMMWGISGMFLSIPVIAMMKVIFDRVDGLTPWGILLGDEEQPPRKLLSLKRKVTNAIIHEEAKPPEEKPKL